jgi:serine/threonine-protein phosphatase 6 regulatory ankyrin repeat subunit B
VNLFQAIRKNNLETLQKLLQDSPDLEQQEPGGAETPLTLAVSLTRVEALKLLLEAGADPSYVLPDLGMKLTILQAAASKPEPELVRALIDAGADLNATNVMGSTALNEALDKGHLEAVDALLYAGADVNVGTQGFQKSPALIQAVGHAYFDLIPRLLALGAEVNQANREGATPLMFALVADAEWRNARPTEELDRRQREIIEQLLSAGADPNAALTQQVYLFHDGSSLSEGMTPLMVAAGKGDRDLVQRLLEAGADRSLQDVKKQTALDWAVNAGHPEVVTCLQEHGASESVDTEKLQITSLMTAAREGNVHQLQKLIKERVDVNAVDPDRSQWGRTALIHAIMEKHFPAVELLLQAGADPNQREKMGRRENNSPLHHAAAWKDSRFTKVLLEAGADPDPMNNEQQTPLVDAAGHGHRETVELLLQAGASPVLPERENGNEPLWAALQSGHTEVAHRLLDAAYFVRVSVGLR